MESIKEQLNSIEKSFNALKIENDKLKEENQILRNTFSRVLTLFKTDWDKVLKTSPINIFNSEEIKQTNEVSKVVDKEYKLIDLGLPSGTLWMDRNIGANSPEDAGLYFAWGETQGYTADEVGEGKAKQFSWADYKYANGAYDKLTKYCNKSSYGNDGYTDGLTTLETTDDAVLQNVHKYSMPTKEQIVELIKETDVYCIKKDGTEVHGTYQEGTGAGDQMIAWDSKIGSEELLSGIEFRKKADNSIKVFVPCAGGGYEGSMVDVGLGCYLWASSLNEDGPYGAWSLGFYVYGGRCFHLYRCDGLPVRGVVVSAQ